MKSVRRSQLISPWGIGAMVDFPNDESLMTCGLDAWPFANEECPPDFKVLEERLQARLGVDHFRLPPDYRIPGPGVQRPGLRIPFVRFPGWHYCPRCGDMQELSLFGGPQRCVILSETPGKCKGVSPEELVDAAQQRLDSGGSVQTRPEQSEEECRHVEYEALKSGRGGDQTDLFAVRKESGEYRSPVSDFFSTVTLVHKLRETRAFCGFSRYLPDDTRPRDQKIEDLRLNPRVNWLPAIVVRGEGIFLDLHSRIVWGQGDVLK